MSFRDALDRHLRAIRERDLDGLIETLPKDELTLVTSGGRVIKSTDEFIALNREWFAQTTWSLDAVIVNVVESRDLGVAMLHVERRESTPGQAPVRERSFLSLVFAVRDGRWVMIQNQSTPIDPVDVGTT